jgi:DNA gyrase subunit A
MLGVEPPEGPKKATFGRHDVLRQRVATTTHSTIWLVTSKARVFGIPADSIEEVSGRRRGTAVSDLAALDKGEQPLCLVAPPTVDRPAPLMFVSSGGSVKRVEVEEVVGTPAGKPAMKLKPGESLVAAFAAPDESEVLLVASNAQAMRCAADAVPIQGRGAGGVAGMKLASGASVVGAGLADEGAVVLSVTDGQTAKVTDASEIPTKGRNTAGLRLTKFRKEKRLEWAWVGHQDDVLVIVGQADAPSKPDPSPEPLTIPHTGRDLVSKSTKRRMLDIGFGRW